jgi:hypothetical protein
MMQSTESMDDRRARMIEADYEWEQVEFGKFSVAG